MKKFIGSILVLTLFLTTVYVASAQEAPITTPQVAVCPQEIIDSVIAIKSAFYIQIEPQAESADLPSERLEDMFRQYHTAQTTIRNILSNSLVRREEITANSGAYADCRTKISNHIVEMRSVFLELYLEVARRKRNFMLLEKYDQVNGELQVLSEDIHALRSNINTFHDQLPCFIKDCISK